MAVRRRSGTSKSSTFEDFRQFPDEPSEPSSTSLAAKAIRASNAYRNSSLSFAYGDAGVSYDEFVHSNDSEYSRAPLKSLKEEKEGFWGIFARKTKELIEDDSVSQNTEYHGKQRNSTEEQQTIQSRSRWAIESEEKSESSTAGKRSDAIAASERDIGHTMKNGFEENINITENRTTDGIRETNKCPNRTTTLNQYAKASPMNNYQPDYDSNLKASRNVANAMAAKAKLLLRELKSIKADLAFAKERCTQLEEENKKLRENRQKGVNAADDDLIRFQLETLMAEKARLAQENSQYARENRFLREIVEYHQLTMQNVVYLDEQGIEDAIEEVDEEVEEVLSIHESNYPSPSRSVAGSLSPIPLCGSASLGRRSSSSRSGIFMPQSPTSPRSPH